MVDVPPPRSSMAPSASRCIEKMQKMSQERAPFAMMLQSISTAALAKGVSGFVVGPLPDYTKYADIKKA